MSVDALQGEVVSAKEPVNDDKTIYLIVGDRSFPCKRTSVSWHMMQFGHAQRKAQRIRTLHPDVDGKTHDCPVCQKAASDRSNAGMEMMAAMRALILKILKPEVRQDFEDFMDNEAELDPNELENAIGNTIALLGNQDSDSGKA